jgi:transcriptional regulator with XRE-family HTH domain
MKLKEARERLGLTQEQIAERLGVTPLTVHRWEQGKASPRRYQLTGIYEAYGVSTLLEQGDAAANTIIPQDPAANQLILDPIARLAALPFSSFKSSDNLAHIVRQYSEKAMNLQSRRDFLKGTLASLVLLPVSGVRSSGYEERLRDCEVGIAAAQEMSRSTNAADLRLAYDAMSVYSGIIEMIAKNAARLQPRAMELLAHCAVLKTILGWHCIGDAATLTIAKQALSLSRQAYEKSGDPNLSLSAYSKLAWAYSYLDEDEKALQTAQEAEGFLLGQDAAQIAACIRGGTYSTLGLMQARTEQNPDEALGKAIEANPGNEIVAYMEFTEEDIPLESGLIHYHAGNQVKAMEAFEGIVDPHSLKPKSPFTCRSERGRLSTIHAMAQSCLLKPDRDMEQITTYWQAIAEGAQALQSEWFLNKSRLLYKDLRIAFPGEHRVAELRPLIAHW